MTKRLAPDDFTNADLRDITLVIWQASLPQGDSAEALRQFVNEGGRLIFFPPGETTTTRFAGLGWGEKQEADDEPFKVGRWDEDQGPLANTDEGLLLPLQPTHRSAAAATSAWPSGRARGVQRRPDTARTSGAWPRGGLFLLHLPLLTWSELGDGMVVVPMLQRLLAAGGARLQRDSVAECGKVGAGDLQLEWTSVETSQRGDVATQAGVYQAGDRWLVVNRPAAESEFERVEDEAVAALFGGLSFQLFQAKRDDTALQRDLAHVPVFHAARAARRGMADPAEGRRGDPDEPAPNPNPPLPHEPLVICSLNLILLTGVGVMVLSTWLGWSIWQRNGRRGKVGLLELLRFARRDPAGLHAVAAGNSCG